VLIVLTALGAQLNAQTNSPNTDYRKLTIAAGAGVTIPAGPISNHLSTGWNITGGAGYYFTRNFAVIPELTYTGLGVQNSFIKALGAPGANSHIWAWTLNPEVRFRTSKRLGFYLIGGPGYYRRILNLTTPTQVSSYYLGYFGYYPITYTANQTISTVERVGWGGNAGVGFTYKLGWAGAKLFGEVRYHYASTYPRKTQFIPITFGISW
jgi:hypothetical protein